MSNHTEPMTNQQPSTSTTSKHRRTAAVIIAAITIAAGIAAVCWFLLRTPSSQTPLEAITACLAQLGEQFSTDELGTSFLEQQLDSSLMQKRMKEKGQNAKLSITLEDSDISELSLISGITADCRFQNDVKNQQSRTSLSAFIMGLGGDIGFYTDKDQIAVFSDEFLPETLLSLEKDELQNFLNEKIPDSKSSYIKSLLEQQYTQLSSGVRDFNEYALKQLPNSLLSFAKNWEIKSDNQTDTLSIAQNTYECHAYQISIDSQAFKEFLKDYGSWLSKYDYENNSFFCMLNELYQKTNKDSLPNRIRQLLTQLPDTIQTEATDHLDLMMYISSKGRLLGADLKFIYQEETISLELRFGGEKPGQDIYLNANGQIAAANFNFHCSSTHTVNEQTETSLVNMSLESDTQELLKLNSEYNYDTKEDSFAQAVIINGRIDHQAVSAEINAKGCYKDIKKGKSYKLNIDKLSLNIDADDIPFSKLELSADISCSVLENKIKAPQGTSFDLMHLTDKDMKTILNTMKKSRILSYLLQAVPDDTIDTYIQNFLSGKHYES